MNRKLIKRLLALILIYIANFILAKFVVQWLLTDLKDQSYKIISLDISASFIAIAMLALYFLFLQVTPYFLVLYMKHNDIFYEEERRIIRYLGITIPLGIMGSLFSYYVVKDMIIPFFMEFNRFVGVEEVIGFHQIVNLIIIQGITFFLIFQLPLILKFITSIGLVSKHQLKSKKIRVGVFLFVLILSSWLTPTDPLSTMMVLIPIYTCYEVGILISKNT